MRQRGPAVRAALATVIAALSLVATPAPGTAAPPNPSDDEIEAGREQVIRAAERVGVLANRVAAAGAALTAAQLELAATYDEVTAARQEQRVARAEADAAHAAAAAARADADAASARIRRAQQQVDEFVAASFRQGSVVGSITAFLGSDSPEDLLDRAALLDSVSGSQLDALDAMRRAQIEKANLDSAARAALQEARARQQAATEAKAAADTAYAAAVAAEAAARRRNVELLAREADLERRLAEARRALNRLEVQRQRFEDWQAAQRAAAPAAPASRPPPSAPADTSGEGLRPSGIVAPASGTITSTYGPRWGSIHYGLDIANEIGTPIVSVMDGRVISSGPASGFGLWVRVRHDDGTVTVYGHINEALVFVGERVVAGEQIATVGNRGESTGPHLHFEVHMNGRKVDPLVWLRSNGVSI